MLAFFNSIAEIESLCNANEPNRDFDCSNPIVVYLSKVKNGNTRTVCQICSKLTLKIQEQCQ